METGPYFGGVARKTRNARLPLLHWATELSELKMSTTILQTLLIQRPKNMCLLIRQPKIHFVLQNLINNNKIFVFCLHFDSSCASALLLKSLVVGLCTSPRHRVMDHYCYTGNFLDFFWFLTCLRSLVSVTCGRINSLHLSQA